MKVKYRLFETGKMPLLNIVLKKGSKTYPLTALVDSGAAESLFSEDVADALGIDLTGCSEQLYYGIGDVTVKGHTCNIGLKIPKFDEWIIIQAGFVPNEFPVIGHSGFFENYEVTFRGYQDTFEIKRKPKQELSDEEN